MELSLFELTGTFETAYIGPKRITTSPKFYGNGIWLGEIFIPMGDIHGDRFLGISSLVSRNIKCAIDNK